MWRNQKYIAQIVASIKHRKDYLCELYYEFKSGKNFETIRRIITNDRIKCDICGNESEEEFLNRYQQHYEKLTEKEKEIKGTIDIAVDEFWRILEQ